MTVTLPQTPEQQKRANLVEQAQEEVFLFRETRVVVLGWGNALAQVCVDTRGQHRQRNSDEIWITTWGSVEQVAADPTHVFTEEMLTVDPSYA